MGVHHDLVALAAQLQRPGYGRELRFAGTELPDPTPVRVPTRHGRVRCLRYPGSRAGHLVHFHGGAFMTRHPQMDDFWYGAPSFKDAARRAEPTAHRCGRTTSRGFRRRS